MGIKKFNSIAYHPQGNAAAERSVKTVKERLTAVLAAAAGNDWDDLAPLVSFAINSTNLVRVHGVLPLRAGLRATGAAPP